MKNKLFVLGMTALLCALGAVVVSCDDGNGGGGGGSNLPVKTISWESDGNGYTQFYTNDTQNCDYSFTASAAHSGNTYETEVKKVSGNATYGYGMLFCYDSSASPSYYSLLIDTTGYYYINKCVNGTWAATPIKAWTTSAALNTGYNQANKLKVVQAGTSFTVYINNQNVDSFTDSDGDVNGTKIGAYVGVGSATDESFPNTPVDVRFKILQ